MTPDTLPPSAKSRRARLYPRDARAAEPAPPDTTEPTQARVMMLLPADLLQGGEAVILLLKPSPWYILLESIGVMIVLAVFMAIGLWLQSHGYNSSLSGRDLLLLVFGLGSIQLFWQFLEWLSRVYVLTDQRVIRVKGVLRVQVFETQLRNVQHTHATFSLRERLFGLGSIHIATAGTGDIEASWVMLAKPLEAHRILVQALNRYR